MTFTEENNSYYTKKNSGKQKGDVGNGNTPLVGDIDEMI